MKTTLSTVVKALGNNTGIEVPAHNLLELGGGKKPAVKVSLSGYTYSSTVGTMSGLSMIPLSAAHRKASGLEPRDPVEVTLELDLEPRTFEPPEDLVATLEGQAGKRAAFDASAPSRRKEWVRQGLEAKAQDTRQRRIEKVLEGLMSTEG